MTVSRHRLNFKMGGGGYQLVIDHGGAGNTMYFSDSEYGGRAGASKVSRECLRIVREAATAAALKELKHIRKTKP
jgi:hypothetical protein